MLLNYNTLNLSPFHSSLHKAFMEEEDGGEALMIYHFAKRRFQTPGTAEVRFHYSIHTVRRKVLSQDLK